MIFITGTDTNIGKTLVSTWLCLHTGYAYFKPVQTGLSEGRDSDFVATHAKVKIYPEIYTYQTPVSPHLAAQLEGPAIELSHVHLPVSERLIVEGAGGVLVPLNQNTLMVDLMKQFDIPVILVASTRLGTINHTLMSLEILRRQQLHVLGVILTGEPNVENHAAIEHYGQVSILASLPWLRTVNYANLARIPLNFPLGYKNEFN